MDTPILDFVSRYAQSGTLRLHMPGHKGIPLLGMEELDITEVSGADSLYEAEGIIRRSEENASELFGCPTYYSTEGSSQCIRAMLLLAVQNCKKKHGRIRVLAGRNAHKTFLSACALLDLEPIWFRGEYLSCRVTAEEVEEAISREQPDAVYLTSPDYLGNRVDIAEIARICHRHGVLLLVDNAHGAYLKFLQPSLHPVDLGADLCCDSAHKTLPALTGGAYLHISAQLPEVYRQGAKNALGMFGSTSPSYLILQSLDRVNAYVSDGYVQRLNDFSAAVEHSKAKLSEHGYEALGAEPLKITMAPKSFGYTGTDLAQQLRRQGMECEFADPDYLVLMLTPEIGSCALNRVVNFLRSLPRKAAIFAKPPQIPNLERVLSVRQAALAASERVPIGQCEGRVLAAASVGCPPAVPIAICGERLDKSAAACFAYYGIDSCYVVCE